MININVISGQFCDLVDELTFHLETSEGILLISVELYTINFTTFANAADAVFYILNN